MGFFAKTFLAVTSWSNEDLADAVHDLTAAQVKNHNTTPWGDVSKIDSHQRAYAGITAKLAQVERELSRRGVTSAQVHYKKLMRQMKK